MNFFTLFRDIMFGKNANGGGLVDLATGGAFTKQRQAADAQGQAEKNAQIAQDASAIAESQRIQGLDITRSNLDLAAKGVSAGAKANAINAFQAQSSATADLASSGLEGTSSPFLALSSQVEATKTQTSDWFSRAMTSLNLEGQKSSMELANQDQNISLLNNRAGQYRVEAQKLADSNSPLQRGLSVLGGFAQTAASVYSLGSMANAGILAAKAGGFDSLASMQGMGLGDLMQMGGAKQFAQMTGTSYDDSLSMLKGQGGPAMSPLLDAYKYPGATQAAAGFSIPMQYKPQIRTPSPLGGY